jgi:hypothetical protein
MADDYRQRLADALTNLCSEHDHGDDCPKCKERLASVLDIRDRELDKLEWRAERRDAEARELADLAEAETGRADEAERHAEQADAVTAETKRLMERRTATLLARAERAEAAVERMRRLIDSYPPGSDFVQSGAAQIFRDYLNGDKRFEEGR